MQHSERRPSKWRLRWLTRLRKWVRICPIFETNQHLHWLFRIGMMVDMTIPPLRNSISYWTINIQHQDGFNGWAVKDSDEVFVSPTGYPAIKARATFRTRVEAETFLAQNRETIDRRCASKLGFVSYQISEFRSYWPVEYDELIDLTNVGRKGRPRIKSQGVK